MVKKGRLRPSDVPARTKDKERHPLFGALKGTVFIPPGVDLTEPADPDWADIAEGKEVPPARGVRTPFPIPEK